MATFIGLIFSRRGRIVAPSWTVLATSVGPSCPILAHLVPSRLHLGPSWHHLGPILAHLGSILDHRGPHLGPILAPSWPRLAQSWPILAPSLSFLGHFLQQLLSCPSLSNFLSNFSLSAGGCRPPAPPRFRSGFCPGRQGKRGHVFSSSHLSCFCPLLFGRDLFSDTKIKSPVRTVPRLCR